MFVKHGDPMFDQHLSILTSEHMTAQVECDNGDRYTIVSRPGVVVVVKDNDNAGVVYQGDKLFFNNNLALLYEGDLWGNPHNAKFVFDVFAFDILTN